MRFSALLAAPLLASLSQAIDIDVNSPDSIKKAASTAAAKLADLYPQNQTWFIPGLWGLIDDNQNLGYYWWEGGAAMGAWVDYWAYTNDSTYNDMVSTALQFQVGDKDNYEPSNQTLSLGNDDQAFWGIAAMSAAERGFPNPPANKPQWLALAQAVYNRQTARWDPQTCNGGIRWQAVSTNAGYNYKNTISNGLLMHLSARLARYTGNQTYADWAEKIYKWEQDMGLVKNGTIFDGATVPKCTVSDELQWTYNSGVHLSAAAYLYDFYTNNTKKQQEWLTEVNTLLNATHLAFINTDTKYTPGVMWEAACESAGSGGVPTCNTDQRSFKAYLSRMLGYTWSLVNVDSVRTTIMTMLQTSAQAAAKSCTGAPGGNTCGLSWRKAAFDGAPYGVAIGGVGEHMAAMEVFQSLLVSDNSSAKMPLSAHSGGTSKGNVNAGTNDADLTNQNTVKPSTTGDKAGAGILTTICLGGLFGLTFWLIKE